MEEFVQKIKTNTTYHGTSLNLSKTQDCLANNLLYLDQLNQNDDQRDILTNVTHMYYSFNNATSLEWLKYFPNLTELTCNVNKLDSASLKSLEHVPKLEVLDIFYNDIDDLSSLRFVPNLCELICEHNKIKILSSADIVLPNLQKLECSYNELTHIDVSKYSLLKRLVCDNNYLTTIVLQNMPKLKELRCSYNKLIILNITECKKLKILSCACNELTNLDLQGLINLRFVWCRSNKLNTLNMKECKALEILDCDNNQLSSIYLSDYHPNLKILSCKNNESLNIDKLIEKCKDFISLNLKYI